MHEMFYDTDDCFECVKEIEDYEEEPFRKYNKFLKKLFNTAFSEF